MELISREATIKSLCDYHKGKKTIGQCIDDVPTIQAVPIEVLQEIRDELTKHYVDPYNRNTFRSTTISLLDVLDLIDKHINAYQYDPQERSEE